MQLLDMPTDAVLAVMEATVTSLGLFQTFQLRRVHSFFHQEIPRAVARTQLLDRHLNDVYHMSSAPLVDYLLRRSAADGTCKRNLSALINEAMAFLSNFETAGLIKLRRPKNEYKEALCNLAVWHLTPRGAIEALRYQGADDIPESCSAMKTPGRYAFLAVISLGDIVLFSALFYKIEATSEKARSVLMPALQIAAEFGRYEIAKLILDHDMHTNVTPSAYHRAINGAALGGHLDLVRLFLEPQYAPAMGALQYKNALGEAVVSGHKDIVHLLLDHAKANQQQLLSHLLDFVLGESSFHGQEGLVRKMLEQGANVNGQDSQCKTPLTRAMSRGHESIARLLVANQAECSKMSRYGPMYTAVFKGSINMVKLLLDAGVDVNGGGKVTTPLFVAAAHKPDPAMVRFLLENGASPHVRRNICDVEVSVGELAIKEAVRGGCERTVQILIQHGVSVHHSH